jgi:hypothetical protein
MSEWISVKYRLPDESDVVLVYGENACDWVHEVALWEGGSWVDRGEALDGVSHWMPLPEPPVPELTIREALKEIVKVLERTGELTITYDPSGSVTITVPQEKA